MKSLIAAAATLPLLASVALAQDDAAKMPYPKIVVTGEGRADVAPDMAIISFSVLREADTARGALDANNAAMAEVLAAMKQAGVADRDLQTSGFSIQPRYVYPTDSNGVQRPKIDGYTVQNTLTVRLRDITLVGAVLDRAVTLGVNQGGDIVFSNAEPKAAIEQARRKAMEDAIARARTLTEAAGIRLGPILDIAETQYVPPPRPMYRMEAAAAPAADAVPVASGENSYTVNVTVTFGLEQGAAE